MSKAQNILLHPHITAAVTDGSNVLPDYAGEGLFNLAVSLARVCGASVSRDYPDLRLSSGADASEWNTAKTVVLFFVDGLGDDFLRANQSLAPNLWRHRDRAITSVFPSTTATAITTLMTAAPASVHGMLGWFVRDSKSGEIFAPLPMRHRTGELVDDAPLLARTLTTPGVFASAQRECHFVTLPELAEGHYSNFHRVGTRTHTYAELPELPAAVEQAVCGTSSPQFVYAYTPDLDACGHQFGMNSVPSRTLLAEIDRVFADLCARLPDALIIVSADHGFIDCPSERNLNFADYPELQLMLRGPMSGERRAAYCDVRPEFMADFGRLVEAKIGHAVCALPSAQAHAAGLFGPGEGRAQDYAGDWILVARDDWTVWDSLPGERPHKLVGMHGGLSPSEMRVPLVLRKPAAD